VTVGIGAMCNHGATGVLASDLRATFPRSRIGEHDFTGKQWDFDVPFPLVACVAGKLGLCQPVVDELNNRLLKLVEKEERIYCEHIDNAIRDARSHMFRRYADWSIRMAYGLTLREWQRGKVPGGEMNKFIHDSVRALLDGLSFEVGLIVLGFLSDGNPIFYRAIGKHHNEATATPAVYVIGSGGTLAMDRLNKRQQCLDFGLPRTLLHISEAMDDAQKVSDKSVGKPQAFMVVQRDGAMHRIDSNAPLFREWKKAYRDRESTASLDDSEIAQKQVAALFRKHEVKRSASRKSEQAK